MTTTNVALFGASGCLGTADILDGRYRQSMSMLARLYEGIVAVLVADAEDTKNRVSFTWSFYVTRLDVLAVLKRATGAKWQTKSSDSQAVIQEHKAKANTGDNKAFGNLAFTLDGDWEARDEFAMDPAGLENEDLDKAVREVADSV